MVALLPFLYNDGPPARVLCPMAGVGAAPILTLAFYREGTRVVVWEDDDFWRSVCLENLRRNDFCANRYEVLHPRMWGQGDGAVIATAPRPNYRDVSRWYDRLSKNLRALDRSLVSGTVIIVSRRVDQGYKECVFTENLILSALYSNMKRASVVEVGEVKNEDEINRHVFVIARV